MTTRERNIHVLRLEKQLVYFEMEAVKIKQRIINFELNQEISWQDSEKEAEDALNVSPLSASLNHIAFPEEAFDSKME